MLTLLAMLTNRAVRAKHARSSAGGSSLIRAAYHYDFTTHSTNLIARLDPRRRRAWWDGRRAPEDVARVREAVAGPDWTTFECDGYRQSASYFANEPGVADDASAR